MTIERLRTVALILNNQKKDLERERVRVVRKLRTTCIHVNYVAGYNPAPLVTGYICACSDCGVKGYESLSGERTTFLGEPQEVLVMAKFKEHVAQFSHLHVG